MSDGVGVFGAVKGLFEYNRENFIFDRTLNQERVYQTQKMRVAQVKLYRDDLRVLFDLTIRKMDSYLVFNALLLLFTGGLFYEGRLPLGSPAWILWLWTMSVGSAFFFLSLSIWLAIHASITAQTFQVRLLTEWLRLPIPSAEDIHAVSGAVTDFEKTRARDMLRVPGVGNKDDVFGCVEKFPDVPNTLLKSDLVQDYTLFVEHFYLFRNLQKHWQGFDAYARIGMVVGTNILMSAFSYMSLAYFLMSYKNVSGLIFPFILTAFQFIHIQTNLRNLNWGERTLMFVFLGIPPLLASIAGFQAVLDNDTYYADILSPVMFAVSGFWIVFLIWLGSEQDGGLPNRFVTVGSIDVLGLDQDDSKFEALSEEDWWNDGNQSAVSTKSGILTEGSDTPVAVAVPPAQVVVKAEERRRCAIQERREKSLTISSNSKNSELRYIPDIGLRAEEPADEIPLESILESIAVDNEKEDTDEKKSDVSQEDDFSADEFARKAKLTPWKSFRHAGTVIASLWIFATVFSVFSSFAPRWGWPRTSPYGDGEEDEYGQRRLVEVALESNFFFFRIDEKSDYGKAIVFLSDEYSKEKRLIFSFDTLQVDSYGIDQNDMLHITYTDGHIHSFQLPVNSL